MRRDHKQSVRIGPEITGNGTKRYLRCDFLFLFQLRLLRTVITSNLSEYPRNYKQICCELTSSLVGFFVLSLPVEPMTLRLRWRRENGGCHDHWRQA